MFSYHDYKWQLNLKCPRCGNKPDHLSSHCHARYITINQKTLEQSGATIPFTSPDAKGEYRILSFGGWRSGVYCSKCNIIYCQECKDNPQLVDRKSWKEEDDSGIG